MARRLPLSRGRRPHVLEFGLRWPPDTFLIRKLERLVTSGVDVTVATDDVPLDALFTLPGVRVLPVIPTERLRVSRAVDAVVQLLAVAFRSPSRAAAVWQASRRPTAAGRAIGRSESVGRLRAYAAAARTRPDILHFEWTTAAAHHLPLADALGCPMVVSCRGADTNIYPHVPSRAKLAAGFPEVFARAAAVHCVADVLAESAVGLGASPDTTEVIRPAVDPERFRPAATWSERDDGVFRLVSVGWLHWRKSHEDVLVAAAALAGEGIPVELDIIGRPPTAEMVAPSDRGCIEHAIRDLGLEERVTVRGWMDPDRIPELLAGADAFVHASVSEGIPNAMLEAMACGTPVVVTDVGGTREAMTDGIEGFLVPPRRPRLLADALRQLWTDPDLRARMGAAGRRRVEREFTLDGQAEAWLVLYRRVLGRTALRQTDLLVVGVRWPPEPFVERQLQALSRRHMRVRAASFLEPGTKVASIDGVGLERLPHWLEGSLRSWAGLGKDATVLLFRDPARLRQLVSVCRGVDGTTRSRFRLYLRLARLRADVIRFEWLSSAAICRPLFDVWRRPIVLACQGSEVDAYPHTPGRSRASWALPELFAGAAAVQCVSEDVLASARRYGLHKGKARLIRPAVDPSFFRPAALPRRADDVFRVISVGWLRWLKGYEYALLAIELLRRQGVNVRYEIVGGEPPAEVGERDERRRILATIEDLGLRDAVLLHGWLEPIAVRDLFQLSDVLLHPSLSEGIPNVILEAMASGLPVVATDAGGTREAVRDGVDGFVVPLRDARAMAAGLLRLSRDADLRRRLGAAGRDRAATHFGFDRQIDDFHALYEQLAFEAGAV